MKKKSKPVIVKAAPKAKAEEAPKTEYKGPAPRLLKLLDEDDAPAIEVQATPVPPKRKLAALMDDDEPVPSAVIVIDDTHIPTAEQTKAAVEWDKKRRKEAPPLPPKVATLLVGTSIVFCGDNPVMIMSGANSTWSDLMCWNIALQTTVHLLRADLEPRQAVDDTISELQKHIKIQSSKRT